MGVILAERYLATGRSVKTATRWSVRVLPVPESTDDAPRR